MALALPLALTGALAAPSAGRRALGCAAGFDIPPRICARRWKPSTPRRAFRCCMDRTWPLDAVAACAALCAGRGAASVAGGHGPDRAGGRRQGFRAAARAQRHPAARCRRRRGIAGPSRRSCSSACWTPCAGSRPARRASTARRWRCGSTGKGRSVRCACWIPRQRGARRGDTRGLAGLAGGRAVRRSGQGLRGAGVAAREPQAGGLRQRALAPPRSANERSRILRVARPDRAAL